jgi:hypothetical protein
LKLISQKRLKCKNSLKYFKCNNFALLVFLIWWPKRSLSLKSSFIWVYFTLKLYKKSNLQNWNILFINKWEPFSIWFPPLRFFLQPRPGIHNLQSFEWVLNQKSDLESRILRAKCASGTDFCDISSVARSSSTQNGRFKSKGWTKH